MIEKILLIESRKQAQIFLHGLEREIISLYDIKNPSLLQEKVDRALTHFHEVNFSIYRLYIFNRKGEILADSLKNKSKIKKMTDYLNPIFNDDQSLVGSKIEYKQSLQKNTTDEIVMVAITDVIIPLHYENEVIAAIEVEINIENTLDNIKIIDDQYDKKVTQIILLSGFVFIIFLWYFLKHQVVTPIQSIEKTAKAITEGKFDSRTHLQGSDEVVHLGHSINTMASSLRDLLDKQEQAYIQVLQSLAKALEAKDPYTAGHSGRVAKFSVKMGKYLKLSKEDMAVLKQGALMHDLGKIAIPDHILNKPDKLTDEEFIVMRNHPVKTADIMKPLRHYERHREIAAWHHERWDGKGYPDRLKGEDIPLMARIVSIADTWDAMTGDRVYRKGMSEEKALSIIKSERDTGQWDPILVDVFIEMMMNGKHADIPDIHSDVI
ncbi:MAG: HD domain-containing protein [gamma proteobacterium symbiont of Taylorina sp.]|nr:HD domain-containing protein [gamma proteobacterium symbiont of Taylorina sp.]